MLVKRVRRWSLWTLVCLTLQVCRIFGSLHGRERKRLFISILANRILNENMTDKKFVKKWFNWETLMNDQVHLNFMVEKGQISKLPADNSFESYMELLKDMYAPYTLGLCSQRDTCSCV